MNRLKEIGYADGKKVNYAYDTLGRRTSMVDSTGTTSYAYDALDRLTSVTNGANQTIGYEWTPTGQRSKVVYPDQTAVTYQYDLLDRMTSVTDGSGLTTNYTYDNRGLLTQKKLPTQGVSTYQYDALGQVLDLRHANQFGKVVEHLQYAYDPVGNRTRLERVEDGNDEDDSDSGEHQDGMITEYAYDALNQLTQVRQYNAQTAATPSLTNYSYDAVGNRLTKQSVWDTLASTEDYTYDPADKLLHWQSGSDYKDYTYDPRGNLLRVMGIENDESLTSLINPTVLNQVYGSGAVTPGVYGTGPALQTASAASASSPELMEEYMWDSANRLKKHRSAKQDVSQFFYDGDGNRTKMIVDIDHGPTDHSNGGNGQGNSNGNRNNGNGNGNNGNGNGQNKCHEVPPGFVPPGLAKKCGQVEEPYPDMHPGGPREGWEKQFKKKHWEYNFTNDVSLANPEPLQVTDKDQLSGANDYYRWKQTYAYGAGGERISMTYLPAYDANNGWDPHDGTAGAEPGVAPRTLFYLNDALGSAVGLIEKDGRVSSRYHYDEFGIPTDAKKFDVNWPGPDNLFGYTGLGYDYNSGLSYARARYYKPEIGRFVSEDSYKGDITNPLSLNLYSYVENNPLTRIDPSGHSYTWALNLISKGYNNGNYNSANASLLIFGANGLSNVIPEWPDADKNPLKEPAFKSLFVPFHEIAQINAAKKLYDIYGKHPELEKRIKRPDKKKGYFEADIVLDNKVWEVKPLNGADPKPQLELYKKYGGFVEGDMLDPIDNITVFDNVKMKLTFPEPGEIRYSLYKVNDDGTIEVLTTVAAAIFVAKALIKMTPYGKGLSPGY